MVTEIYPQIFVNKIPLPGFPINAVNSYIILSDRRNLIIDTGFDTQEGKKAMMHGIRELGVDLDKTDLLLTHMHPDHIGMAAYLQERGTLVFMGETDRELVRRIYSETAGSPLEELYEILYLGEDVIPLRGNNGGDFLHLGEVNLEPVKAKDIFNIGNYSLEVLDIPGHTPGHIGLYERKHRLCFGGDHILEQVTPSVLFWSFECDMLGLYFNSLRKIYELDIDYLYPAHYDIIANHRRRIRQLVCHCSQRLREVKETIAGAKRTPLQIAALLHWNVKERWEDFPKTLKFLAIGETMAFVEHLCHRGIVERTRAGKKLYYETKKGALGNTACTDYDVCNFASVEE